MDTEKSPQEIFLEKHKPKTPEEVKQSLKDAEITRNKYSTDLIEIESNLISFMQKEYPLVDPGTDKIIAWIRQVPLAELKMISINYEEKTKGLNEKELTEKLKTDPTLQAMQFEIMSNLITIPKHEASWWAEHATPEFIQLFDARWEEILSKIVGETSFF